MIGFDTSVFPRLDPRQPASFYEKIRAIDECFETAVDLDALQRAARPFLEAFDRIDPFIQSYTELICPTCWNVCCAQIHGLPEFADVVGFRALGLFVPDYDLTRDLNGPCQFMGDRGCLLPRIQRPYRCTWYFCEPLLFQIEIGPSSQYRHFIEMVQALALARGGLMRAFLPFWERYAKNP